MKTVDSCPICESQMFKPFLVCTDYTVSKERFNIVVCGGCGFKFTSPRPEDSETGSYYKSEEYISHSNTKKGLVSRVYHLVRNYTLNKKEALLRTYVSRGTLLDYGCGTGMFAARCSGLGWNVWGMEPDEGARKTAKDIGVKAYENKAELTQAIPDRSLNAVTLWHVLEHVTDLSETLDFFKLKLTGEGVLVIAVPNHTSYDALKYGEYWAAYDVPRHLYHFDINSVSKLLKKHGFELQAAHPMKFDSFYVSMLSEKYKTGAVNVIKAFITGLLSNWRANKPHNYSSVIYVFKIAK